ncbi:hypothetical protein HMN09_00587500 [Mycena chlorophos]|uniref:Uncharacterized protein n=1 Tax=Mycena chlorophos TaxID=658473 RepID=A0A8H6T2G4_MYCCL|nr:hypothetical protein HMN09_00587500 [Mycena chlorophos]
MDTHVLVLCASPTSGNQWEQLRLPAGLEATPSNVAHALAARTPASWEVERTGQFTFRARRTPNTGRACYKESTPLLDETRHLLAKAQDALDKCTKSHDELMKRLDTLRAENAMFREFFIDHLKTNIENLESGHTKRVRMEAADIILRHLDDVVFAQDSEAIRCLQSQGYDHIIQLLRVGVESLSDSDEHLVSSVNSTLVAPSEESQSRPCHTSTVDQMLQEGGPEGLLSISEDPESSRALGRQLDRLRAQLQRFTETAGPWAT